MSDRALAIRAIALTSLRTRLRRPASVVLFLLLAATSWLVIPDLRQGRALMTLGKSRSLYDSTSLSIGTALLAGLLVSLLGYYILSSSLRNDLVTRTGFVAAATPVGNGAYLLGKWLGNCLYLGVILSGYLGGVMIMHLLRAERVLRPDIYLWHYALLLGPLVCAVSAIAVVFEATPGLGGRFGDLLYFFCWAFGLTLPAVLIEKADARWVLLLDSSGIGAVLSSYRAITETHHGLSIGGGNPFNPALPPVALPVLPFSLLGWRLGAALIPMALLAPAAWWFRRFDPARVKVPAPGAGDGLFARLNRFAGRLFAPLARGLSAVLPGLSGREASLTFRLLPIALPCALVSAALGAFSASGALTGPPLAWAVLTLVTLWADLAPRDPAHAVRVQLFSAPGMREGYPLVKLRAALWLALLVAGPLALRLALHAPFTALALLAGLALFAAAAVLLGLATGSPKAFLATGLLALYISTQAGKDVPALDFFGAFGTATPATAGATAGAALLCAGLAVVLWRVRLARDA